MQKILTIIISNKKLIIGGKVIYVMCECCDEIKAVENNAIECPVCGKPLFDDDKDSYEDYDYARIG